MMGSKHNASLKCYGVCYDDMCLLAILNQVVKIWPRVSQAVRMDNLVDVVRRTCHSS